jgi:PAS domain S-box-containing protein
VSVAAVTGDRRLEQLYEISKLFAAFDVVEHTFDAALQVIAEKLPLESAILIEATIGGHTDMIVWPSHGSDPRRLRAAKIHASDAYAYLVGAGSFAALDLQEELREELGPTALPAPDRGDRAPDEVQRFIVIPLVVGRGVVFGALQLEGAVQLDRNDLAFVNAIANQLAIALDRSRAWSHDVVRRQEAQRSQVKYETLVDHLDYAFVWEADAETHKVSYVSAQLEGMLGFTRQRCLDEPDWWDAHVHAVDRDRLRQTFERAIAEPGNKRCEHRCIAADGSVRWLRTSIHLVGTGGEPPHLQGVSFDITAARTAQEQVREQLSFTSAMASSLAEGTLAIDLEDRITFINDAGAGLLGCSDRDMLGQRASDLLRVETTEGEPIESPLTVALRTARIRSDALVFVRTDGRRFSASYTATPIRRDGRLTGTVLAFDDITERKQAQQAERFLLGASKLLGATLESTAAVSAAARLGVPLIGDVCFLDLVSADDQLRHVAWAHADPAIERGVDDLFGSDARPPVFANLVAAVVAIGQSTRLAIVTDDALAIGDLPFVRGLGIRSALSVPLTLGARQIGALTFCMTGDRLHREDDLALAEELARRSAFAIEHARRYAQARQAVALREQTLAIVSHDLRSPLATIAMAASILDDEEMMAANPRSRALAVGKIQLAAHRMDRMIGDLLDFASIEAGRLSIAARPHKVAAIVDESIASFEAAAQEQDIRLLGAAAADLPAVLCDRDRILQVLGNLLGNALKSVRSGGSVELRATLDDRSVVFSVSDTGPGIALADQKRLFERYWRSPDARYKGSGLGLAIARGLIEAHRGRLWVESTPGQGATFAFTVPLADPPPAPDPTGRSTPPTGSSSG